MPERRRDSNILVKEQLRQVIEGNLGLLWQRSDSRARQWASILLLLQFIEYLLKYQVQSHGKDPIKTHDLKILYEDLTEADQKCIEAHFHQLIDNKQRYPKSFRTINKFMERYHNTYELFRYKLLQENFSTDEPYFYIADTFLVLTALMECSDIDFNISKVHNVYEKIIKRMTKRFDKRGIR